MFGKFNLYFLLLGKYLGFPRKIGGFGRENYFPRKLTSAPNEDIMEEISKK